jgi:8-oxo-dGTP pyrophosphatase MutT (NUDIX family)
MTIPDASILFLPRHTTGAGTQYLVVARPDAPFEMSPPGGLVETGETPAQAAVRETWEETGVAAAPHPKPILLYSGISPYDGRRVHVFSSGHYAGEPWAAEGNVVGWMTGGQLVAQASRFGGFYRQMVGELSKMWGVTMPGWWR